VNDCDDTFIRDHEVAPRTRQSRTARPDSDYGLSPNSASIRERPATVVIGIPGFGRILLRNVYRWFERTERGVYRLNSQGQAALHRWPQTLAARMEPSSRSAEQTD